ncbi:hypothetical protein OTK49_01795 [Vibrio coralliirubri]|uniref:cyclic-phosphate processing receiver domain-containing protein n=1 Tax=Vibrio coralliirubri TaxID=1516159 RepID=UPI002284F215|nr:cyclic-phosphate processing receiver domain-containing protein [Vibrio coralliirubri]MCY9861246.1 hypothetical protein [Vibrio coralliirubri]
MKTMIENFNMQGLINVYLDDERVTPEGFIRTYTPVETIELLENNVGNIGFLSLDHDLGDDDGIGTGYHIVLWIEEQVYTNPNYVPPKFIHVHSANGSAAIKMRSGIESIIKKANQNG